MSVKTSKNLGHQNQERTMSVFMSSIASIQMNRLTDIKQGAHFKWRIDCDRIDNTNNDDNNTGVIKKPLNAYQLAVSLVVERL
jgi:hypothetical protein